MNRMNLQAITIVTAVVVTIGFAELYNGQAQGQRGATPGGQQPPAAGTGQPVPARGQVPPGGPAGPGARGARGPAAPATGQASALLDLTGYWVAQITEDYRWRMVAAPKGDFASVPLNQAGQDLANRWDPAKDQADGNQCRPFGAGGIMRMPTRIHITWENENVLKLETDAGTQTRLLRFAAAAEATPGERSWQGSSVASWEQQPPPRGAGGGPGGGLGGPGGFGGPGGGDGGAATDTDDSDAANGIAPAPAAPAVPPAAGGRGAGPRGGPAPGGAGPGGRGPGAFGAGAAAVNAPPGRGGGARGGIRGALKVVTSNLKPGYLRRNGLPYGEKAAVTEYFNLTPETYGNTYLVVTTIVEDPEYLTAAFITSSHFKKLPDTNNGWSPSPCTVP